MKHFYAYVVICLIFNFASLQAQNSYTLKGNVTDEMGVRMPDVSVYFETLQKGTTTNEKGNYSIANLPKGTHQLKVSFIGFKTIIKTIIIDGNVTENFVLQEDNYALEGVIVTAQKREQKNKEVPIAITSYGGKFIENQGTFEYDAFSDYVPGLQIQIQSVNNPGVVVRGITSDSGDSRVEPRVSVFQDGVSISKSRGSVVELYDIERVEVLKGPQGTLFGRGAQIGAMHIIQNKAKNNTSGQLKLGYGNYNQLLATGYFNTPINEHFFVRVAGIYNKRDGYIENLSGGNLNGKETLAFRTSFRYNFSDDTSLDVIGNWQKDTPPGTSFKSGTYAPKGGDTNPNTFADLEQGENLGVDRTVGGVTGILKHRFNEIWDATSITAYREFDSDEAFDADGTAAPALFFREIAKGKQFSQELRFNFDNNDKFSGFFGANYFYENGSQEVPWMVNEQSFAMLLLSPSTFVVNGTPMYLTNIPNNPATFGAIAGAPLYASNTETYINYGKNYSGDIFADATYDVTKKLSLTVGLRATWENINAGYKVIDAKTPSYLGHLTQLYPNILFQTTNGQKIEKNDNFLSLVGRAAIDYDVNENITLFGTVSRGRRPNVINVNASSSEVLSDEIVWSYEIGAKSLFLSNKLQFDFNAYMYDYSNFQTSVTKIENGSLVNRTEDSGNATAYGFETSFQYAFNKNSSVFMNYGYIDASFDNKDSDGNDQKLAGNTFRLTPKHSLSLGINFSKDLSEKLNIFFRPTYTYKSKVFFEETNLPNISQEGYGLLNWRFGVVLNQKYEVNFFMNNTFDKKYIIDAGNTGGAFGIPTFIAGPPRFFGGQVSVKF